MSHPGSKFHSPPLSLGICVRSVTGLPSDDELIMMDEERCMLGTDGIIFVLPADPPLKDSTSVRSFLFRLNIGRDKQKNERKFVNIFLSINFNICFGCSKEPSH